MLRLINNKSPGKRIQPVSFVMKLKVARIIPRTRELAQPELALGKGGEGG